MDLVLVLVVALMVAGLVMATPVGELTPRQVLARLRRPTLDQVMREAGMTAREIREQLFRRWPGEDMRLALAPDREAAEVAWDRNHRREQEQERYQRAVEAEERRREHDRQLRERAIEVRLERLKAGELDPFPPTPPVMPLAGPIGGGPTMPIYAAASLAPLELQNVLGYGYNASGYLDPRFGGGMSHFRPPGEPADGYTPDYPHRPLI